MRFIIFGLMTAIMMTCHNTEKRSSVAVDYVQKQPQRSQALTDDNEIRQIALDARGYPKVTFVLRLDLIENEGAQGSLPKCLQPLTPSMEIAELRCIRGGHIQVKLTAAHMDQICYRDPEAVAVKAKKSINLGKCKLSELQVYHFSPEIRVDIELR